MRDIQVSRPVLIALIGAIVVGGFLYFKSQSGEEVAPPPPVAAATAATGATGGSTAAAGASGATGETMSAAEKKAQKRKEARAKLVRAAKEKGMPLDVYEALQDDKAVLIFFWNPNGQTDQHVNQAVNELKNARGSKLYVVKEKISNKSRYQGIAKVAEITQTPGIVMLYGRAADAWQGYIDETALNSRLTQLLKQG